MMNKVYTPDLLMEKYLAHYFTKDAVIVDVGCLDGRFVKRLLSLGYTNVWGVEPLFYYSSHEREALARKLEKRVPIPIHAREKVPLIPFPYCSVDVVLLNQVIKRVEDKLAHFQEIRRVLKPGGIVLLIFSIKETFMEGHVKLPLFHCFDLKRLLVRFFYRVLVWMGLGKYPDRSQRMDWLRKNF